VYVFCDPAGPLAKSVPLPPRSFESPRISGYDFFNVFIRPTERDPVLPWSRLIPLFSLYVLYGLLALLYRWPIIAQGCLAPSSRLKPRPDLDDRQPTRQHGLIVFSVFPDVSQFRGRKVGHFCFLKTLLVQVAMATLGPLFITPKFSRAS